MGLMKELNDLNNIYQDMYVTEVSADKALEASKKADVERGKAAVAGDKEKAKAKAAQASRLYAKQAAKRKNEEVQISPEVAKLIESGKFSDEELKEIIWNEGYQRNPEKGEAEERKAEKRRKESGRMPPRGDKRREDFEKWYAANVR
jgi:hypothetical protein